MHYVCVEDGKVSSILNYEPNVPESIKVFEVTDEQADLLFSGKATFDVASKTVKSNEIPEADIKNLEKMVFLNSSDWKVLRHVREKAIGVPTSLTEEEYIALEQARQEASKTIIKPQLPE